MSRYVILNIHGIGTPHQGVPEDEKPYWITAERFAEVLDLVGPRAAQGRVRFTFDDGNRSDIDIALPALLSRGLKASFFILAGRFHDPRYLSRADCRSLVDQGMEVGLHGRDHVDWRALDDAALADETVAARAEVAEAAGQPVRAVGVPFGNYNRRVIAHLKAHGFSEIYTSDGGSARKGARVQGRTSLRQAMSLADIEALIERREPVKKTLRRALSTFLRRNVV